jgi:uncharacterized membrane protein YraQ (UPF0718 family)
MIELFEAGLAALREYIALHVLTCLIPAFLLAGAMVTFVSREAIVRNLGAAASKLRSFPLAAGGSFFVAACSCTVIPVSSGLYYGGAGIGAAFILLWVAPAANVLALVYTGAILGPAMVLARVVVALLMAFVVGWVMSTVFAGEEVARSVVGRRLLAGEGDPPQAGVAEPPRLMSRSDLGLILLLVASLLAPNYLVQRGPYQHKVYVWALGMVAVAGYATWAKPKQDLLRWMRETWWFVRLIFPLLLGGVFLVGVIGALLPEAVVRRWLGSESLLSAFVATLIGGVSYFATMTEAPFVDKLMHLGMGKGAALALLLTGPGISLPNWLAVARVFGTKKAVVYVATVMGLGTVCGWLAGRWLL